MSTTPSVLSLAIELESPNHDASEFASSDHRSNNEVDSAHSEITSRVVDAGVPDGGYGWVVVLSSAVLAFWFVGITYSWGVIQESLVRNSLSSASTLSFVGSLTVASLSIFAIINAKTICVLGARGTAILGISIFGVGQLLSSLTTGSIAGLFLTTGVTMGIGARYIYQSPFVSQKLGIGDVAVSRPLIRFEVSALQWLA